MRLSRSVSAVVVVLLVATSFVLAKSKDDPTQVSSTDFVVLKDDSGKPVRNAAVILHPVSKNGKQGKAGFELKTDADGKFAYRGYAPPTMALQDAFEYTLKGPGGVSNAVPIYLTNLKVVPESEANNDTPDTAQALDVPCEVVGRIDKRHDKDWFGFTAKKGDVYYFDLQADRIGSANRVRIPSTGTNDAYPSSLPDAASSWSAPVTGGINGATAMTASNAVQFSD